MSEKLLIVEDDKKLNDGTLSGKRDSFSGLRKLSLRDKILDGKANKTICTGFV